MAHEQFVQKVLNLLESRYVQVTISGSLVSVIKDPSYNCLQISFYLGNDNITFFGSTKSITGLSDPEAVLTAVEEYFIHKARDGIRGNYSGLRPTKIHIDNGMLKGRCTYPLYEYMTQNLISVGCSFYEYDAWMFEIYYDNSEEHNQHLIKKWIDLGIITQI